MAGRLKENVSCKNAKPEKENSERKAVFVVRFPEAEKYTKCDQQIRWLG